jgi:ubiquinol-cytochrome c reductase cytochrome b subunit
MAFYGILWAEGANDVFADKLQIPLYTITWIARVAVFVVPIGAYYVTKRVCLGLQRKDAELLSHGVEIGIIHQLPSGEFVEESRPLTEEERGVVGSKKVPQALPQAAQLDENGIPSPAAKGLMGRARVIANRAFLETVDEAPGHGNGHEGHAVGEGEHAAVTSGDSEAHQP